MRTLLRSVLCLLLASAPAAAQVYTNGIQQPVPLGLGDVASAAPVQSVNNATGAVKLPTYMRQVSAPLTVSTTDGTLTWTFPAAFGNMPTCWPSLAATSTGYTFDYPEQTAISTTAVSYLVTAHPKTLSIASLALPVLLQITPAGPPAGTTLTLSCIAPL